MSSRLLPLAALSLTALAHGGGVRIVGAPQLEAFPTIQAAVDMAVDGDTLLVGTGTYPAFTIDGKALSLVAMPGALVEIEGTITVRNLPLRGVVLVSGVRSTGAAVEYESDPALRVESNAGDVRFQSCTFRGGQGEDGYYPGGCGGPGAIVVNSPRVAFAGCTLVGGNGYGHYNCYDCEGGNGGAGVVCDSNIAMYDCESRGGDGGDTGLFGGLGGSGLRLSGGILFASGSLFAGGDGGDADDFIAAFGGDGGDGLVVLGAEARLLDNVYLGGEGGDSFVSPNLDGADGVGIVNTGGTVLHYPFAARHFSADVLHAGQSSAAITVDGEVGDRVFLAWGQWPDFGFSRRLAGARLVPTPLLQSVAPLGVIDASGTLVLQLPLPDVSELDALYLQGLVVSATGKAVFGGPLYLSTLARAGQPDCNGNQTSDYVDVLEGASPDCDSNVTPDECDPDCNSNSVPDGCDLLDGTSVDCNGNYVPDECDIADGTSADCNANGVPDECDIAAGTSFDLNGNGVPDECEGTMTWYVDASAASGGDGSAGNPFQTIAEGVAPSVNGDIVLVRDGTYSGPGNRDVNFAGRQIVIRSENGALACTVDCEGVGRAFRTEVGQSNAVIEGFTIRDGLAAAPPYAAGGAILSEAGGISVLDCRIFDCTAGSGGAISAYGPVRIEGCLIVNCHATFSGGGIDSLLNDSQPHGVVSVLRENIVIGCTAGTEGGGINAGSVRGHVVSHCTLTDNVAGTRGGGLAARAGVDHPLDEGLFLDNTRFLRNSADEGGALYITLHETRARIASCSFFDNEATSQGGAIFMWSNFSPWQGDIDATNSILWGDSAPLGSEIALAGSQTVLDVSYSDVAGGQAGLATGLNGVVNWGAGNIDLDPLFLDAHLNLGPTSPCVDAGDNTGILLDRSDIDDDGDTLEPVPLDVVRATRRVDVPSVPDTGNGPSPVVDMGALERQR